ncbi:MAG TPA: hypothetical protein VHU18_00420 [Rhizomicrobium sp.]|jgi:hypothetical protein|nr:hypothetical protein [Rhizomicrobium sp.]
MPEIQGSGAAPAAPTRIRKLPVGETIAYAYKFTLAHLGTIIGLCWLPLVLIAVLQFLPYALGGDPMASTENVTMQGRHELESLASSLLILLLYSIMYVPVTRQALGLRQGTAIIHFALGAPEFRVFGALCLFFLVLLTMGIGIGVLGMILTAIALAAGKNALLGLLFAFVILAAVLGFIYAIVRLGFLLVPIAVAEEQISLTRSWILARQNFWRILGVLLSVLLPIYLLHLIGLLAIVGPGLLAPLPSDTNQAEQVLAARFALVGRHMPAYLGLTLILAPFSIGLAIAASAFGYRALAPERGNGMATTA